MNSTLELILTIVDLLCCIVLTLIVLAQSGKGEGLSALGGSAETFFGKNKAKGMEAKLALATKISATVFVVLSVLMMFVG